MYIKAYSAELKRKMRLSYRSEEEGSTYAVGVGNIKAKAQQNHSMYIYQDCKLLASVVYIADPV